MVITRVRASSREDKIRLTSGSCLTRWSARLARTGTHALMRYVRDLAAGLALLAVACGATAQRLSLLDYQVPVSRATSLTLDVG